MRELPDDVLIELAGDTDPEVVASTILTLIHEERPAVASSALVYTRANSRRTSPSCIHDLVFG